MSNTLKELKVIHKEESGECKSPRFDVILDCFLDKCVSIDKSIKDITPSLLNKQIIVSILVFKSVTSDLDYVLLMLQKPLKLFLQQRLKQCIIKNDFERRPKFLSLLPLLISSFHNRKNPN